MSRAEWNPFMPHFSSEAYGGLIGFHTRPFGLSLSKPSPCLRQKESPSTGSGRTVS
ncbi:MAG: hypothetical protein AVDCRST_MAG91-2973 [uncultured Sphingomonadaceae bacterium]|uniref:Uncharacterized protein n=1 Tax=uncultured Sphingomonadaceae bacterium TaxID=169976 RepID=A0A6J4TTK4_9SPHN|nr:MAG: hypothetical protein AVDCRST_MAG91-2973 [uncultured Sphingomonadaceae bacterium]